MEVDKELVSLYDEGKTDSVIQLLNKLSKQEVYIYYLPILLRFPMNLFIYLNSDH